MVWARERAHRIRWFDGSPLRFSYLDVDTSFSTGK